MGRSEGSDPRVVVISRSRYHVSVSLGGKQCIILNCRHRNICLIAALMSCYCLGVTMIDISVCATTTDSMGRSYLRM